ncbi:YkgJ family cysteine cluster protein [Desulfobotulus sp. H1]|uniref:YkgJ family cysteine cluster protein n=1 Tax=Desulfobotulus pelophilus TaxID=2823377 RepID=A0ABT3NAM1_9BACT|nr:YkgJ family cysteine cluster protein [Desulfobotulus pelophilus]MCW7754216.1 YkgJ family cysteine cluster protein [Desulfobotulus pelophilus]
MAKKRTDLPLANHIKRLTFPVSEANHSWLPMLLDAFYIADQGVAAAIHREETKGKKLACSMGCASCCITHRSIPVYPIELVGISWYATEVMPNPLREKLAKKLLSYQPGDPCAFLVETICSIHPMRPLACRHFNVFSTPCAEGEDAFYTRRKDVMVPMQDYMDEAFFHMLPFYGITKAGDRRKIIKKRLQHDAAKELQSLKWAELVRTMTVHDQTKK